LPLELSILQQSARHPLSAYSVILEKLTNQVNQNVSSDVNGS